MALDEPPLTGGHACRDEEYEMLWFYTRDRESLSLETRYDNESHEYVGILTHPDGRRETKRFPTAQAFREWLVTVDHTLTNGKWAQNGAPHILPDGWPDKTPSR
jgi:hypothetical protein